MSIIGDSVREGFEDAHFLRCDGAYECEERCPNPIGQCTCAWVHYRCLPWWKKPFIEKPPRPTEKQVLRNMLDQAVDEAVDNYLSSPEVIAQIVRAIKGRNP